CGFFFFFQAEDGIRDFHVTGVQTCLFRSGYLPLSVVLTTDRIYAAFYDDATAKGFLHSHSYTGNALACRAALATLDIFAADNVRSEERRVGKECGARGWAWCDEQDAWSGG